MSAKNGVRFAQAMSLAKDSHTALNDVIDQLQEHAPRFDLLVVFISHHHEEIFESLPATLRARLGQPMLIGCTGESVIGGSYEAESVPALSILAISMPDVNFVPFHLVFEQTHDGPAFVGWPDELIDHWPNKGCMLLLADPWTMPINQLLEHMEEDAPGIVVAGGMASGARQPGNNRLFLVDTALSHGAVAMLFDGPFTVQTVLSPGCRPIGNRYTITECQKNTIHLLDDEPALERLQEAYNSSAEDDKTLVRAGMLQVGKLIATDGATDDAPLETRIINLIGADRNDGSIVVGDNVEVGQQIQFQVRDAQSATQELNRLLSSVKDGYLPGQSAGLLFTCNGRGTRMFDQPHHDAATVREQLPDLPLAGFFCQGEIGPVAGRSYVHGFTASLLLFTQDDQANPDRTQSEPTEPDEQTT